MHEINKIGKHFWYSTAISLTDRPILGMVVGNNKTLMIDAGNSEDHAKYFLNELLKREVPNPDMVVLTHWHWDHIFGLAALPNTVSIASSETKKSMEKLIPFSWSDDALDERVKEGIEIEFCANAIKEEFKDHRDITIVLPDLTFEKRVELDLGGVTCIVQYVGGDHAADSVIVYIKEDKILFLADCIYPNMYAEKENYTIKETLRLLDELESFDADTYIPSHQKPISKDEFNQEADKLRAIAKYTDSCGGDKQKIIEEYGKYVNRELTEDERVIITDFVNGY
ncbi:MBL fold metallo-hydrolase [Oceanobacillus sp. 143]|uniref:Zn-dependent hydrolase n=1 Tax=Oceanobacillus zhaokaii TaxID=2052660 RepID=A0A345PLV0_9BACI|nr:MBL fold metallo-hydrolase [Oceanobacillus zhaokaii]AXI10980.1 Zn-dependent hydrolase [Oceanobacillus zhaokaii]QGS69803.1 MBL fold metallo-hydrolase [Oceanobacillus sp. 143]